MSTGRAAQESFRKRIKNFLRRANEIASKYGADIFIIVRRKGTVRTYTSSGWYDGWPSTREEVKNQFPQAIMLTPDNFVEECRDKGPEVEESAVVGHDATSIDEEVATLLSGRGSRKRPRKSHIREPPVLRSYMLRARA